MGDLNTLSGHTGAMLDNGFGYRDDGLFGDGVTNPIEICHYECQDLGNTDILDCILEYYGDKITNEEANYLRAIIRFNDFEADDDEYDDDVEEIGEIDKEYFSDIIKKIIGDRNYAVWLCNEPQNIYKSYICMDTKLEDENVPTLEEYLASGNVVKYDIPKDAMVLSDLGESGALVVYKK